MTEQYPNPCCRCGFCCMAETCIVAWELYGIPKNTSCPFLEYDTEKMEATCTITHTGLIGIGKGCCIKARCFKDGVQYDFASLPDEMKKNVALSVWRKRHDEK